MKSMLKFAVVCSFAVLVSGCGDKKGGVNDSGVEADGTCSSNVASDVRSLGDEMNGAKDVATVKSACSKFTTKYPKRFTCIAKETGRKFDSGTILDLCAAI